MTTRSRWATRLRNKNIPPSPEEVNLLKAFSTGTPPAPVSGYYPTLALVGGAPAGAVLEKLFLSGDAACPRGRGRDVQPRYFR